MTMGKRFRSLTLGFNPHIEGWDATENPMTPTVAGSRTGMDEYELHGHLSEQLFRAVGGFFANFSSSVSRISQEI